MDNTWQETIGNTPPIDLRQKTVQTLNAFEINKRRVEEETKKYALIWASLTKEEKKKINNDAVEIVKTRAYPQMEMTMRFVKYELLDKLGK